MIAQTTFFAVAFAALFGPIIWIFCGMPVRAPWKQAKIDELKGAALQTAFVFSRTDGPLNPQQAEAVAARIAEYRQRVQAIEDTYWREAHLCWVHYSERNMRIAVKQHEYEVRRSARMAVLALRDPLAGIAG